MHSKYTCKAVRLGGCLMASHARTAKRPNGPRQASKFKISVHETYEAIQATATHTYQGHHQRSSDSSGKSRELHGSGGLVVFLWQSVCVVWNGTEIISVGLPTSERKGKGGRSVGGWISVRLVPHCEADASPWHNLCIYVHE